MISIYRIFAPTFFNFEIIFALRFFLCLWGFPLGFYFQFLFWHSTLIPLNKVKDVVVAQPGPGNMCVWASGGSLWVHSNFVIRVPPEINTHSVTTLWLPKGKSLSPCLCLSMEVIAWLACKMILPTNRALLIARYFNPIVIANHERYSIQVQLVSSDWSIAKMNIYFATFHPNGADSDGVGRLLR